MLRNWLITNEKPSPSPEAAEPETEPLPAPSPQSVPDSTPSSTLPFELTELIIEYSLPRLRWNTYKQRQSILLSLCLTSRLFRQIAQPLLFHVAKVSEKQYRQLAFLRGSTNLHLVKHVRALFIEGYQEDWDQYENGTRLILEACSSLESLTFGGDHPSQIWASLAKRPYFSSLVLLNSTFGKSAASIQPVNLQHLTLVKPSHKSRILLKLLNHETLPHLLSLAFFICEGSYGSGCILTQDLAVTLTGCTEFLGGIIALAFEFDLITLMGYVDFAAIADATLVTFNSGGYREEDIWSVVRYLAVARQNREEAYEAINQAVESPAKTPDLEVIFLSRELLGAAKYAGYGDAVGFIEKLLSSCQSRKLTVVWHDAPDELGYPSGAWPIFREMRMMEMRREYERLNEEEGM